jgi:hypothetical protein
MTRHRFLILRLHMSKADADESVVGLKKLEEVEVERSFPVR